MSDQRRRLSPLPIREWPDGMRDAMAALTPPRPRYAFPRTEGRSKGLNILGMLALHPELATAFHTLNGHLLFASTIAPRERELVVLRVAHVRDCEYEWKQHAVQCGDAGLTIDDVRRVAEGPEAEGWAPVDRVLLRAVDELLDGATVSDATWAELTGELDDQQILDLVFTVGIYETLSMAVRALGIPLDDDLVEAFEALNHAS